MKPLRTLCLSTVVVLLSAACTTAGQPATGEVPTPTEAAVATEVSEPTVAAAVDALAPPTEYALADVAMTLERGPCYGFCPVYTVTVRGDGTVAYNGENYVATTGEQTGSVTQDEAMALLNEFYKYDYMALRPEYRDETVATLGPDGLVHVEVRSPTDMATQTVTLQLGTWKKVVVDYWNAPAGLKAIEEAIDKTANTQQWVGTPGQPTSAP
jgi:hypothetical protein